MKANAPEKIYISTSSQDGTYYISNQYKRLIEYTRSDAFIDKTVKFLRNNLEGYDLQEEDVDRIIEDFKTVIVL